MKVDLDEWLKELPGRRQLTIREPVSVVGTYDKHLGPSWAFAQIELTAEPAEAWDVRVALSDDERVEMLKDDWLREALLGVLDVLVSRPSDPLLRIRITVTAARFSFESSRRAFRAAGRRAAEALLDAAAIEP